MGVLDQVTQLQNQGMGEEEIVSNLQSQGVAPKEITDAINQAKIKGAVTDEQGAAQGMPPAGAPTAGGGYTPQTQEVGENAMVQQGAAPQEYYEEGAYEQGAVGGGMDSDMIIEIANQVFTEKIKKLQDKLDEVNEFKTLTQVKVDSMEERLKRIEKMIDNLQIKILEEVGSYGNELKKTQKEVAMIEGSMGRKHTPHTTATPKAVPKVAKKNHSKKK